MENLFKYIKNASLLEIIIFLVILLFIISTFFLVKQNWNDEIRFKVITGIIIGTATIFISTFASLKSHQIKQSFITCMVIDSNTRLPIISSTRSGSKVNLRFSDYYWLAQYLVEEEKDKEVFIKNLNDENEKDKLLLDLMQYKLFKDLKNFNNTRLSSQIVDKRYKLKRTNYFSLSNPLYLQGESILKILANNRFSKVEKEVTTWNGSRISIPKGTEVSISSVEGQRTINLYNKNYFKVILSIRRFAPALNALPKGFVFEEKIPDTYLGYRFEVNMNAEIFKLTSQSKESKIYSEWIKSLFDAFQQNYSDEEG